MLASLKTTADPHQIIVLMPKTYKKVAEFLEDLTYVSSSLHNKHTRLSKAVDTKNTNLTNLHFVMPSSCQAFGSLKEFDTKLTSLQEALTLPKSVNGVIDAFSLFSEEDTQTFGEDWQHFIRSKGGFGEDNFAQAMQPTYREEIKHNFAKLFDFDFENWASKLALLTAFKAGPSHPGYDVLKTILLVTHDPLRNIRWRRANFTESLDWFLALVANDQTFGTVDITRLLGRSGQKDLTPDISDEQTKIYTQFVYQKPQSETPWENDSDESDCVFQSLESSLTGCENILTYSNNNIHKQKIFSLDSTTRPVIVVQSNNPNERVKIVF